MSLTDAHCHPTDSPETLDAIASMLTEKLVCMSTAFHDIDSVAALAERFPSKVVPAYGYHPWFTHLVYVDENKKDKYDHYRSVLVPCPTDEFIDQLPDPQPFSDYLEKMHDYLSNNVYAIVGELGLDKVFKLPHPPLCPGQKGSLSQYKVNIDHQVKIFTLQLKMAVNLSRPLSIHSVQTASLMFDTINFVLEELNVSLPETPNICLHSYSGSPEFLSSCWYKAKHLKDKVYVSCSVLINITSKKKASDISLAVPPNKILVESDYHSAGSDMDSHTQSGISRLGSAYGWDNAEATTRLHSNFYEFLQIPSTY